MNFADEVTLGTALSRIVNAPKPAVPEIELFGVDVPRIRRIIDSIPEDGYIAPNYVQALLHAAGIPLVDEFVSDNKEEIVAFCPSVRISGSCQGCWSCAQIRCRWCRFEH